MHNPIIFCISVIAVLLITVVILCRALYKIYLDRKIKSGTVADKIINLFEIPRQTFFQARIRKAIRLWNLNADRIQADIKNCSSKNEQFLATNSWTQLVWQEIHMYIMIGAQVDPKELATLCKARGFTELQSSYITEIMYNVGLGKNLTRTPGFYFKTKK